MKLTKKQRQVYDFIDNYIKTYNISPSYRDIAAGLHLSSVSSVAEHINNLVKLGALKKSDGEAHSLEVIDYRHPETVALFTQKISEISAEEKSESQKKRIDTLRLAATILDLELEEK
ncbi:MAG: hypothetical protein Q4F60_01670 [Candidatus Saccharibacteria bacterium]|nr:hypothetical protein [Candidatus Saccharibacteria bacterium]